MILNMQISSKYHCIECGHQADELYKNFNGGSAIKICHCEGCGKVVDKYIEYDPVLIFLDAVLHKKQAYRHLLFNYTTTIWKMALLFLLCDAYIKWDNLDTTQARRTAQQDTHIFYAALEWDIYTVFTISLLEWVVCSVTTLCLVLLDDRLLHSDHVTRDQSDPLITCSLLIHRALVMSSFGKLLAIPAVIWGQTHSSIYLLLARAFVVTSNISAIQTVRETGSKQSSTVLIVVAGHTAQYLVGLCITDWLYTT